jgi:hypothetical protein|tara:strand:- start:14 stop:463 length:450 start_codon:yes stop_codon:yes gene_type:complete
MATTVTNANLTVTVTDTVTLNGQSYGNTNTLTVASIDEVYSRVVEVPISAFTPVLQLGSTGQGQLTAANCKYIRITNLDDTNYVNLKVFGTDAMVIKLEAGKSFMLGGVSFDAAAADIAQGAVSHNSAFVISAEASVAPCDLEVFAATI